MNEYEFASVLVFLLYSLYMHQQLDFWLCDICWGATLLRATPTYVTEPDFLVEFIENEKY